MSERVVIFFHEAAEGSPFAALACKAEASFLSNRLANFLADVRVTRGTRIAPAPAEDGTTRVNGMAQLAAKVVVHLVEAAPDVASVALVDVATDGQYDTMDYRYRVSPEREPTGPDPDGEARIMLSIMNLDNGGAWVGLAEDYP